jgi:hypothetical protein
MRDDLTDTDRDKSFQQMLGSFLRDDLAPAGPDCLAPGAAAAYYAGALSEAEARSVEAHLAGCGACQAEIALFARLEAGGAVEPEARKAASDAGGASGRTSSSSLELREPTPPIVPHPSRSGTPTSEPKEPVVLRDAESPPESAPAERDEASESFRHDTEWFPRRRRARWSWMGAAALSVAAVLAISVTYHFAPLIDEASRRAAEPDSVAPRTTTETGKSKDAEEYTALPAPPPEAQPAPTAAPFFSDALTEDKTSVANEPHSEIPAERLPSMPPSTDLPEYATAQPPPASVDARRPAEHKAVAPSRSSSKAGKQPEEALRASSAPPAPSTPPALAGAAQAPVGVRPVVVVARSNLDVTWRLTGTEIERSDDAGKTWQRQPATTGAPLLAGSAPSDEVCWAAGANGTLLRSRDGQHWERLASPTSADIVQIIAWSASSASIRTASDERFSTDDGGQTWSKP